MLERHPAEKDKMDGHLAVMSVRKRGATEVDLLCATGGRLGALFAVPHILLAAERMGVRAAWGRAFVLEAENRTVTGTPRDSAFVFPLIGPATGVTLDGFVHPLADARLEIGDTLGFHNELIGSTARMSVHEGALLVIHETQEVPD